MGSVMPLSNQEVEAYARQRRIVLRPQEIDALIVLDTVRRKAHEDDG